MGVEFVKGDLLRSDCNIIIHQCNSFSTMGAGLALKIAKKWPEVFITDKNLKMDPMDRFGSFSWVLVEGDTKIVVNLYGQYYFGRKHWDRMENDLDYRKKTYKAFETGLRSALEEVKEFFGNTKIGMPSGIGCGLGSDWLVISGIIKRVAKEQDVDIYIYELE